MSGLFSYFSEISTIQVVRRSDEFESFISNLFIIHKGNELNADLWPDAIRNAICMQQYELFERQLKSEYVDLTDYVLKMINEPIGRVVLDLQSTHIYFVYMAIIPEMQKKGIGKSIMEKLIGYARNEKLPVYIKVANDNQAIQLYPRLGFHIIDKNEICTLMAYNRTNEHVSHVQL